MYEATRGWWVIGPRRTDADYAFAVSRGVAREVYRLDGWRRQRAGIAASLSPAVSVGRVLPAQQATNRALIDEMLTYPFCDNGSLFVTSARLNAAAVCGPSTPSIGPGLKP
jgi:hypothetical protein